LPDDIFDTHADDYSEEINKTLGKYGANHEFFFSHKSWLIEDLLQRRGVDLSTVKIADIGCGVGKLHEYLKGRVAGIVGVDVSQGSIEVARKQYPEFEYKCYDGNRLPLDDGSFDLTMAIGVFHHVPPEQWEQLTAEMLRVLRPGGWCLVIEHNPFNPVTRRIVSTCPIDEGVVLLRPSKLKGLFENAGAVDITSRTILSIPPKTDLLKRIDSFLGALPLGAQHYLIAKKPV